MHQTLPKNTAFRIGFPLLYGSAIYILILLVFENFNTLLESFFNKEWIFTVFLTYLSSELIHMLSKFIALKFSFRKSIRKYIIAQLVSTLSAEILLVLISIHVYFTWLEGFSVYFTELKIFEIFFIFSVLLYNLFIFSYLFLHEENTIQHEQEIESLRKSEYQIQALKNEIEPDLFYIIMESLILYIQKNETISNEMIGRLSEFYRYRLENKHNELIKMRHEKLAAENLLCLLNYVYPDSIYFRFEERPEFDDYLIVPLWLQKILFTILKCNILSPVQKFNISIDFKDDSLVLKHDKREKLLISEAQEIQKISSEIEFYTHKKISIENQSNEVSITIPLFNEGATVEEMPDKNELNQSVKK